MDELRLINNLEIIEEINNAALKGKLKCNCGCNEFYIYHTGKQTKGILSPEIVKHKKQVVINAQCVNCKEIIKIFDSTIDSIKPINAKQYEFKKLVLKKDIDTFKIIIMYNYIFGGKNHEKEKIARPCDGISCPYGVTYRMSHRQGTT